MLDRSGLEFSFDCIMLSVTGPMKTKNLAQFPSLQPTRFVKSVSFLTALILFGCETPKIALEGNPMPEAQVNRFLVIVSPKSTYDVPPKFVKGFAPDFPETEAYKRQWGYANIEFAIRTDGKTDDFKLIAATSPNFAEESYDTLQNWVFKPAQKNGHPVAVRARVPFTFRLSH
jgi:TonB family protein